jgi:hypothetical protein
LKISVPCAVGLQERIYGGATAGQKRRLNVSRAREHMWIAKLKRLPGNMCADKEKGTGSRIARIVRQNHAAEFGRAAQPLGHLVGDVGDANDRFPDVPLVAQLHADRSAYRRLPS